MTALVVKWQARWRDGDPWFDVPNFSTALSYSSMCYEVRALVAQPFTNEEEEQDAVPRSN